MHTQGRVTLRSLTSLHFHTRSVQAFFAMSGCSIAKHAGWRLHGCIACISNNSATIVMARRAKQNQEQDQIPAALAHIARTKAHIARTKAHHDTDIAQTDAHYSSVCH